MMYSAAPSPLPDFSYSSFATQTTHSMLFLLNGQNTECVSDGLWFHGEVWGDNSLDPEKRATGFYVMT